MLSSTMCVSRFKLRELSLVARSFTCWDFDSSILFFETEFLVSQWAWCSLIGLKPLAFFWIHFSSAGIIGGYYHAWLLTRVLGNQSSCWLSHFPNPLMKKMTSLYILYNIDYSVSSKKSFTYLNLVVGDGVLPCCPDWLQTHRYK